MGLADIKNDVKTLFLILNTLFGLLPGLMGISAGIGIGVVTSSEMNHGAEGVLIAVAVVGFLTLLVSVLGYCGAIKDNRIMLYVYAGVMALAVVGDILALLMAGKDYMSATMSIVHLAGVVLCLVLAVILAGLGRRDANQGCILSPAPTSYTPTV